MQRLFTFEEVFQVGQAPATLLFPISCSFLKTEPRNSDTLKGLVLRGKNGEEKGVIEDVETTVGSFGMIQPVYHVRTSKGELKPERSFAPDALTVLWADIANKGFVSAVNLRR